MRLCSGEEGEEREEVDVETEGEVPGVEPTFTVPADRGQVSVMRLSDCGACYLLDVLR